MTMRATGVPGVEMVIVPPVRDLGDGFNVRRALPSAHRRMVGPFIFFDHFGEVVFTSGQGMDVRPHPHIGLATVTYLIEGELLHRDSGGAVQEIHPGQVNWMTAGSGIVHSERTPPSVRQGEHKLYGLQTWVALPTSHEEVDAHFAHYPDVPRTSGDGLDLTLIAGTCHGLKSPVITFSEMIYAEIQMAQGVRYSIPTEHEERALYVVSGALEVDGAGGFGEAELVVLKPKAEIIITATRPTRLMVVGGAPFPEKRHIYWNFVSSDAQRIEAAKADWRERRFPGVPGESEFIPLPDDAATTRPA